MGIAALWNSGDAPTAPPFEAALKEVESQEGAVGILVNNAGITRDQILLRMKEEDRDLVLAVNLKGTFNCTKAALRHLVKQKSGKIVNIASVVGVMGNAGQANYSAAKAGLLALSRSVAREYASRGITCNVVAPGPIVTSMTETLGEEWMRSTEGHVPALESLRLLSTPPYHRTFFRWAAVVAAVAFVSLFLPWQQTVQATGEVTALNPSDRPQAVNVVIGGRIVSWDVREGQSVKAGDPIVHLADVKDLYLDPRALDRQREALAAKESAVGAKREKVAALARQLAALRDGLTTSLDKGRNKVAWYESAVQSAVLDSTVAAAQLARQEALYAEGLKSLTELEGARTKALKAYATAVEKRNEQIGRAHV